jgi:hypothetical protein
VPILEAGSGSQRAVKTAGGVDSTTLAFPGNVNKDNLLVVLGSCWDNAGAPASIAVSDSRGTSYAVLLSADATNKFTIFIAYGIAPSSGACTVTVDPSGSASDLGFAIDEFSGVNAAALDVDGSFSAFSTSTPQDDITTLSANDLVLGVMSFAGATQTITKGASYTEIGQNQLTNNAQPFGAEFAIVSPAQLYTVDWVISGTPAWRVYTAAFKRSIAVAPSVADIFLYPGEANQNDVKLSDPTVLRTGGNALAGTSDGVASASATLTATGDLAGTSAGVASSSANLTGTGALTGSSAGVGAATGTIAAIGTLAGSSAGIASATATLLGSGLLAGQADGVATASGTLDVPSGAMVGSSVGVATATGTLTASGALAGSSAGIASGTATLLGAGILAGQADGIATATGTGTLTSPGEMAGVASGTSTATGTLLGSGALVGQADGTSTATLTVTAIGATGGGGFWRPWRLGIGPYLIPKPLPQDVNVTLSGIRITVKVGELKAEGQIDITDDELLLILAAVAMTDDEPDESSEAEYAALLVAAAAFCELAQATVNWEVDCD